MAPLITAFRPVPGALLRELRAMRLYGPGAVEALRPVLSVLIAVTAADLLQLDELIWAAFSGFMVMRGDIGLSIRRGFNRIAGTLGGALVGLLLAPAVADNPLLLVVSLFVVSWVGTFKTLTSRYSYAWTFFGLTAGLVLTEALAAPAMVVHFAGTRVAEIVVGTLACLIVASLSSRAETPDGTQPADTITIRWGGLKEILRDEWLSEHKPLLEHSTRAALAVALLPLIWRWFEIEDFAQTAVTSYVVMLVPAVVVRERRHETIYERMAHRTLGCLLGCAAGLVTIAMVGDELLPAILILCAGVWIGYHIQSGHEGISYLGTQFVLGLLVTLVQGPGPVSSILPGLERLLGIVIGLAMLWLMILLWPLPDDDSPDPSFT